MIPLWATFTYFIHQIVGINWMLTKERKGTTVPNGNKDGNATVFGGLQCDDMGLGKTIQICGTMVNNPLPGTLLLAPLAMVETWTSICDRSGFRVFNMEKGKWVCANPLTIVPEHFSKMCPSVYITNYDKVLHNFEECNYEWSRIVLDEAHKICNPKGKITLMIRRLHAPIRWAVTGTPIVNSLQDMVSLLAFLDVPLVNSYLWNSQYMKIIPKLLIHRSMESLRGIIKDLPPHPEIIKEVLPFSTVEEEDFYNGVQCTDEDLAADYAQDIMTTADTFKLLLRLRQLSVHPQVYINAKRREDSTYERDDWEESTTKFEHIKTIIDEDDTQQVHKYIIFCQFMDEMHMLEEELSMLVPHVLLYNGSMKQHARDEVLAFSKTTTETTVLLIQLQAGGVGLNLQEYDRIIFVSPWWTSALMDQAIARAVRMGQQKIVKVYHLELATETSNQSIINIDEMVQKKAEEKREMLKRIFELCIKENGTYILKIKPLCRKKSA
jgi:SNF2 family DNA or RNA helicase